MRSRAVLRRRLPAIVLSLLFTVLPMQGALAASGVKPPPEQVQSAAPLTGREVEERLAAAEGRWPDGAAYVSTADAEGCATCFGFARELFYYVFDVRMPNYWSVSSPAASFMPGMKYYENVREVARLGRGYSLQELRDLIREAKPGDVLIASNFRTNHATIVRSVDGRGEGVYVYDNNWETANHISANRYWTAEDIQYNKPGAVALYRCVTSPYDQNLQRDGAALSIDAENVVVAQGSRKGMSGTILSTGSEISSVGVSISDPMGGVLMSKSLPARVHSYALSGSELDWELPLSRLDAGTYQLRYTARCADGVAASKTVRVTVLER